MITASYRSITRSLVTDSVKMRYFLLQFDGEIPPMRADNLNLQELLVLDPEGGVIRFAGQRALLIDAVAMGLLRKYLVENFGLTAARTVLTQFGFAHGWRLAEAMQSEFKWDSEEEWLRAGPRIHTLEGLFRVEAESTGALSREGMVIGASYESEQHLLHFGRADVPVCWTISGLTSGYLSRCTGKEIYALEDRCIGKGDAACHLFGRTRDEWGDERAEELRFYEPKRLADCLDVSLHRVTETLKAAERKLREHRSAIVRVAPDVEEPLGIVAKSPAMRKLVARNGSRGSSTRNPRASRGPSSRSTAAPSRRRSSRANSSDTPGARSPARPRTGRACSRRPTWGPFFSTRSGRSRRACR
jgi:two-component system response regulator HydG